MNLLAELKRRQMVRVAAAYAVVAWLLIQLVNNLAPMLRLPEWAGSFFLMLLLIGFPVVLIFAWVHELEPASEDGALARVKTGKLDWTLIGALIVVIGLVSYQQLATDGPTATQPQAGVDAAKAAAASPTTGISLAVLPFTNLSSDKEQEFFSDGMTEEITSALARIPDLRVVARTSAFEFKGQNRNIQSIGQQLKASHLIEGSVRKVGDRVRITAQLIKAADGTHVWSENYDRQLTDIFAIQEEIARSIATSFNMRLGLSPGENLVASRTVDVDLYQQFLRTRAQVRALNVQRIRQEAISELEKLVARDPNFAPAWSYLSGLYITIQNPVHFAVMTRPPEETRRLLQPGQEKAEKAAREAIRLDPRQAFAYSNLALLEANRKRWAAAEDLHRKALELDPNDPDVLASYAAFSFETGRLKDASRMIQQARALEPLDSGHATGLAITLMADGQADAAVAVFESTPPRQGGQYVVAAEAYAMVGRFDDAAAQILRINLNNFGPGQPMEEAARLISTAPTKVSDPKALPAWHQWVNWVYAYVGAPERLLDYPERALEANEMHRVFRLFTREYAPVRNTERFKTLVRDMGLVDYWKARGWPDLCRPVGANDFACE